MKKPATTAATVTARFVWIKDRNTTYSMTVLSNGRVFLKNDANVELGLSCVSFAFAHRIGSEAGAAMVKEAAVAGLVALRNLTKLDWKAA